MKFSDSRELSNQLKTVNTREDYLTWRTAWRSAYKELSREIREQKASRKQYTWKRNSLPRTEGVKRRVKVGENASYDRDASYRVHALSSLASRMMEIREESRELARAATAAKHQVPEAA